MKWLPVPRVPIWQIQLSKLAKALRTAGCFSQICFSPGAKGWAASLRTFPPLVLTAAHRHIATDLIEDPPQRFFVEVVGGERKTRGHHPATDIDADGCRNDGPVRRDHAADCGANAGMHVRHGCDVMMNDGQLGDICQLLPGAGFHVGRPGKDGDAAALKCF